MKWLDQMHHFCFLNVEFLTSFFTLLFHRHQEALYFLFTFCLKGGIICISEVIDISPSNFDSSLCFIQPSVSQLSRPSQSLHWNWVPTTSVWALVTCHTSLLSWGSPALIPSNVFFSSLSNALLLSFSLTGSYYQWPLLTYLVHHPECLNSQGSEIVFLTFSLYFFPSILISPQPWKTWSDFSRSHS